MCSFMRGGIIGTVKVYHLNWLSLSQTVEEAAQRVGYTRQCQGHDQRKIAVLLVKGLSLHNEALFHEMHGHIAVKEIVCAVL